jgi:hypothetical protein
MNPVIALFALLSILFSATPEGTAHRLVIITGPSGPFRDLSTDNLRGIFLGRITRAGGRRIVPVILGNTDPAQRYFLAKVIGIDEIDFTQVWIGAVFRGEVAAPPRVARSARDAIVYVASHPGAIGFIDERDLQLGVTPVTVDGRTYHDADYPFQWISR